MYYVYVLKSLNHNRLYIGMTKDLTRRLKEHDHGKTKSLKSYLPVQLIHVEYYQNKKVALQREQQIKRSGKIRQELKKRIYTAPSSNG